MVQPPPVAKRQAVEFREVEPGKVVVVGVKLSQGEAIALATQAVVALTVAVVLTCPLWGIALAVVLSVAKG